MAEAGRDERPTNDDSPSHIMAAQPRKVSKLVFYNALMFTVLPLGAYLLFKPSKNQLAEETRKISAMREVKANKEKTKDIVKLILESNKDEKRDAEIDKLLKKGSS